VDSHQDAFARPNRPAVLPSSSPHAIEWAAEELLLGHVVAFPTDTVYGLAASLAHPEAIDRIFDIKGRDAERKLPILISSIDALQQLTPRVSGRLQSLLDRFWPGAVTFVLPSNRSLPDGVVSNNMTIAVRIPNHPLAIEVIERAGGAVACTSANRSNEPPALHATDVVTALGERVDFVLDGGVAPGGRASTIVAAEGNSLEILRSGPVEEVTIRLAWENGTERE
jgi:L-threonylcarbamoyladenylate synthase